MVLRKENAVTQLPAVKSGVGAVEQSPKQGNFTRRLKVNMKQRILDECPIKYEFMGDYSVHTTYSSNGFSTLSEYVAEAKIKGISELAVTDCCRWDKDADGHFTNFAQLPEIIDEVHILKGIEAYILPNSQLTASFETLAQLNWVTAVLARNKGFRPDVDYARVIHDIITDSRFNVKVLGRLIQWYGKLPMDSIIRNCKNNNILVDVDVSYITSPNEMERAQEFLKLCRKHEARIIVSSSARHISELGEFYMLFIPLSQVQYPPELIYNLRR